MRTLSSLAVVVALLALACGNAPESKQYELTGQIIAINPERQEVLVSHEDIPGFMPAMTMPFKVKEAALLEGTAPGDLITATLVVEETDAYLSVLTRTGSAPLENPPPAPLITASDLLREGEIVPDHALVDQDGLPRSMASLRGHRVALTFIYSRCPLPDFCPRMDRNFAEVQKVLSETPELADVRLVTVTFDPEFDTPEVLKAHARRLQADPTRWHFVTGAPAEVMSFARRFGVIAEPGEEGGMMLHNLRTAVIDPEGRLVTVHSGNLWTPAELVADLKAAPAPAS